MTTSTTVLLALNSHFTIYNVELNSIIIMACTVGYTYVVKCDVHDGMKLAGAVEFNVTALKITGVDAIIVRPEAPERSRHCKVH